MENQTTLVLDVQMPVNGLPVLGSFTVCSLLFRLAQSHAGVLSMVVAARLIMIAPARRIRPYFMGIIAVWERQNTKMDLLTL
jgi:hypothetical protein